MAAFIKICLFLLIALVYCSEVYGQNGRGRGNSGGRGMSGSRRGSGGSGGGRNYASGTGGGRGNRRYRSTLYDDDDVYGYEANYPGGEALYINYRSSEARAKRAPEFARSGPYGRSGGLAYGGMQDQGEMMYEAPGFAPQW